MEETDRSPQEELSYIRRILEKTADDMKAAAPWFARFGVVWLVYGLLTAAERLCAPHLPTPAALGAVSAAFAVLSWVFYAALAVGYLVIRRKQACSGSGSLTVKLIDTWGVCILLFVALSVCLGVVIPAVQARLLPLDRSYALLLACGAAQGWLFFLLPAAPLLITAVFLEERRLLWLGVVIAVIAAALLTCNTLLLFAGGQSVDGAWLWLSTAAACLLDIAPGGMLLLFARALKRG